MAKKEIKLGRWGEGVAADYLVERGYQILARNVYSVHGEIDLVARQGGTDENRLIFVEVKTRKASTFGYPEEAVTGDKLDRLQGSVLDYLQRRPTGPDLWQIDVIAVRVLPDQSEPEIIHIENVIP